MKTPEEIKILAHKFVSKDGHFEKTAFNQTTWGFTERGFIEGYTQCQKDNDFLDLQIRIMANTIDTLEQTILLLKQRK